MLRFSLQPIYDEMMIFNKEQEPLDVNALLIPMMERIVELIGEDDSDDKLWDLIGEYENHFNLNINTESICNYIYDAIMKYRRSHRYDSRLRMRLDSSFAQKGLGFVFVVMDLDATLGALKERPVNENENDIDDLVSANPTSEELDSLEKAAKESEQSRRKSRTR